MKPLVKDWMSDAFVRLSATLAPAAARQQLPAPTHYAVIIDAAGAPLALVTAADLAQAEQQPAVTLAEAQFPALLTIGSELTMQTLAESAALVWLDLGAHGAVVVDDQRVAGVLPAAAIDAYLGSGAYCLPTKTMSGPSASLSDIALGGSHQTPLATVSCVALVEGALCGYHNRLTFFDRHHPPTCQNPNLAPHTLQLPMGGAAHV